MAITTVNTVTSQTGTGWSINVSSCALSSDVSVKDFLVFDDGVVMSNTNFTKNSSTQITYNGTAIALSVITVIRQTPSIRVNVPAYRSTIQLVDYNGELDRIYSILADLYTNGVYGAGAISTSTLFTNPVSFSNGIGFSADITGVAPYRSNYLTYGKGTKAVVMGLMGNTNTDAAVNGFNIDSDLANYVDRDSVTLYAENATPTPTADLTTVTGYTTTTVTVSSPVDTSVLKFGMYIDTKHGTKYSGKLTSWNLAGTVLTVTGWYQQGNTAAGQTPPGTTGAYVNPVTKIWAQNSNTYLQASPAIATASSGYELGVLNNRSDPGNDTSLPTSWGFDCVSFGSFNASIAFQQRGVFYTGYSSRDARTAGFKVAKASIVDPTYGFVSYQTTGSPYAYFNDTDERMKLNNNGQLSIGSKTLATFPLVDFRTGFNHTYGARIIASGGSATDGSATLEITAALVNLTNKPNQLTASTLEIVNADWVRQSIRPCVLATVGGAQSITNNTETTVTWTETSDLDNVFASPTFTVPTGAGGLYRCEVTNLIMSGNNQNLALAYKINGGTTVYFTPTLTTATDVISGQAGSFTVNLAAADTLVIRILQVNTGAAARTVNSGNLVIYKLGEIS